MSTKKTHQLLAAVLSIVMILSLMVVPAGAAVPMGGEAVAETPVEDAQGASLSSVQRPAANTAEPAELLDATGKTDIDVWDFGAEQLTDTDAYHFVNHLNADIINSWYDVGITPGSANNNFPSTGMPDVDGLSYTTGGATNHRLRTTNTALTRNDDKNMNGDGNDPYVPGDVTYNGYIYSNSSKNTNVYFQIAVQAGDIVTAIISSNGTDSLINWEGPSGVEATCLQNLGSSSKGMTMTFYAKETGNYKIYSSTEKLTMARLYREHAKEVTVSGTIVEPEGMPASYSVLFTNTKTGAETAIAVSEGAYSGTLMAPYSYDVSLKDAEGFAILEGTSLDLTGNEATATHDLKLQAIDRVAVTGAITGLTADDVAKLELLFTPTGDGIVYVPKATVTTDETTGAVSYSVMAEKDMPYTVSAKWINDYEITVPAALTGLTWTADATVDLTFAKKATHAVTIAPEGVTLASLANATFTFTKLDEAGETEDQTVVPFNPKSDTNLEGTPYNYVYTFTGTDGIALRDGTYNVAVETTAGKQNVTSNLVVNGADVTKTISFTPAASFVAPGTYDFTPAAASLDDVDGISGNFTPHGSGHGLVHNGADGTITLSLAEPSNITMVGCKYSVDKTTNTIPTPTTSAGEIVTEGAVDGTADPVYTISGVSGEVTISFSATAYVHSITVESATPKTVAAGTYDFSTVAANAAPTIDGMKFVTMVGHGDAHGINTTGGAGSITLNMAEKGTITVTGCQFSAKDEGGTAILAPTVTGGTLTADTSAADPVYTITDAEGEVTISFSATAYVHSVKVEYPETVYYGTLWDFKNDGNTGDSYYPAGETSVTLADKNGLGKMVVSGGSKFKGHSVGSAGNGYTMTVPVMTACTVKVTGNYNWWIWADGTNVTSSATEEAPATHTDGTNPVVFTYTGTEPGEVVIHACAARAADEATGVTKIGDTYIESVEVVYDSSVELPQPPVVEDIVLTVGADKQYQTITAALEAAAAVKREATQRITIEIDPGDYEEQLYIKVKNLTLKNASATPSIALKDKGVGIDDNAVRITWYYGHGYTYYSMTKGHRYDADVLAVNKANGYPSYINAGSGSTDDSYWNASVLVAADGFQAEGIIFENSFNQYVSAKSVEDVIVPQGSAKEGGVSRADMKTVGDTTVQQKDYVERAGALSIKSGTNIWFDNCAFVGRQDVLYGPEGSKVALYGCDIYGGTDYIYGGMTMVAAKCNLILNTSENNNDVAYITAPQQKSARGYLMYNCTVKSTTPGVNTASSLVSKPCYFGRPWTGGTGEAAFINTNIEHTDPSYIGVVIDKNAGEAGKGTASLIVPVGWNSSLGGESTKSVEYGTVECCEGVDNSASRASWSKVLTAEEAANYTVAAFLGADWDPFTENNKDMTVAAQEKHTAITPATLPTEIAITAPASTTLAVGDEVTLTATVTPTEATQTVTWSSSDVTVATVDDAGKVTAVAGGEVTITARTANGMLSDNVKFVVNIPVTGVTLNKSTITMGAGRSTTLEATVEPANATNQNVTFASSDENVVTVDATGKVKAIGGGTATITVTTEDGEKTAECAVTISGEPYTPPVPSADGKIVILHSNDVHGAVDGYAKMAQLKADYEAAGAEVLVLDAGDFSQGTTYVSVSQGASAIELMNLAGYDAATTGNHEFDYGAENLNTLVTKANFKIMAANIKDASGATAYTSHVIFTLGEGESAKKVGVFGLETPETATKAHPAKIKGLSFLAEDELYACAKAEVEALTTAGADYIICLGHLGIDAESEPNRSIDLLDAAKGNVTGIDVLIDGHSHSTLDAIAAATNADRTVNGTVITSTGTKFANIGVVTIDGETITTENVPADTITVTAESAKAVQAKADAIKAQIDADYGAKFATSLVDLNGERDPGNRTEETNLGDLICDAMLWLATKDQLSVPDENVIALTNGGGIRAAIAKGDVTKNDVNTVLPFGNTVAVDYVKGSVLLEALEASTYCTPTAVGGFPQVAGIQFTVDTTKTFDEGDLYPGSTYHKPNSINRVSIQSVNGKAFDPEATYAVVTNDFVAAGGDTYYALSVSETITDTGIPLDEALMQYITTVLGGTIGEDYAEPQGRITVIALTAAEKLAAAIKAAQAELDGTEISADGSDVYTTDLWTDQAAHDTLAAAIKAAEDAAKEEGADLAAAAETLNDAVAVFKAAQKDGTKTRRPISGTPTTNTNTNTTTTVTNDKGDVAKTVTKPGGDKTITVTNADGEVVAEVSIPATIPANKAKFKDVPEGHWAEQSIDNMAALGMVKGVNEAQDIFDMESTMTRASVATMFFRLSNGKDGITSTFEDVAEGQWYTDAIGWAAKTGVVTGYSETAFGPDDTITRQQLAVMLQRYANLIGMDTKANANGLTAFTDADQAADWAVDGLAWCVKNGIMKGRGGDVLDPTAEITRTEATAMFDRMIALMQE